ncbi:phosphatase PAP2 family protein [Bosea caraganae]|uniref:Phosphatase PAP2 family protein n=1 Tax=Bosea caraganae TaxID=2763117 RepID=A0A370LBY3_9HYPH|nr:phosphatase PAP2 family protein [Bosea caraganae]RDJ27472.1 phosphatase PAP2 family protein [Bosea caraganae]RDJ29487.1 phosphatase PAP2 family protein [Bosea caraganae]
MPRHAPRSLFRLPLKVAAILVPAALLVSLSPAAAQQRTSLIWLDSTKIDIARTIGLPPAQNSPENRKEFEEVLQLTLSRTPEREKAAIADQYQTLARFLEGMGVDAKLNEHREVRLLFREAQVELGILLLGVRRLTARQRPFTVWNKVRVKPCPGGRPEGTSFPSTHAATAALYAALLGEAVPEMKDKFEERVASYDESRLICGFHYRSDLPAGDKAGRLVATALLLDRAFRSRFDETRAEIRKSFGLT